MKRITDLLFTSCSHLSIMVLLLFSDFLKKKQKSTTKKILALPYYPLNWPGGHERIANWKAHFEKDGFVFDVLWASTDKEFLKYHESTNWIKRYYFYFLILNRRLRLIFHLKNYDTIWIQRAFIPFYPYKDAYFESFLSKIHPKIIFDYYDADYVSNFNLTINSVRGASKISVSTNFLKEYFSTLNNNCFLVNMTIDHTKYFLKKTYNKQELKIGWMGNSGNLIYIKKLEKELKEIEILFPNVSFHFLCRTSPELNLSRVTLYSWNDDGFDYYNWLSQLDIGIAPYFDEKDTLKAKSSMKTLEFMASGIPLITSTYGTFEKMVNNEHYILANTNEEWIKNIKKLIANPNLRKEIGKSGYDFFIANHIYEVNYETLKHILLE